MRRPTNHVCRRVRPLCHELHRARTRPVRELPWRLPMISSIGNGSDLRPSASATAWNVTWMISQPSTTKMLSSSPTAICGPTGENDFAIIHRPLFPGTDAPEMARDAEPRAVDVSKENIWISYTPSEPANENQRCLCDFRPHHRLAFPVANWEHLKMGGGTPPFLTKHGWLIFYHGVCGM